MNAIGWQKITIKQLQTMKRAHKLEVGLAKNREMLVKLASISQNETTFSTELRSLLLVILLQNS
jgi:hypothetical protein